MDLKGKVILNMPLVTGEGKNGQWSKQEFLIETGDQYPKKVMFGLMGNKIDQNPYSIGQEVVVSFDAESREYNGRYFTNLNAWKVTPAGSPPNQPTQPSAPQNNHTEAPTSMSFSSDESTSDDLPF